MHCFISVKVGTIFTTRPALQSSQKDILLILKQSKMVYKFQCQCDGDYTGRTIQRLEVWVMQHVPWELLRQPQNSLSGSTQIQESTIGDYLVDHYICRTTYSDGCFSVLYNTSSKQYLSFLEAIAFMLYCLNLCRQIRQFNILCLFGELGGNRRSWIFSPPPTAI